MKRVGPVLLVAALLASCGGDDGGASDSTAATPATTEGGASDATDGTDTTVAPEATNAPDDTEAPSGGDSRVGVPDPCVLLSAEDIQAAIGESPEPTVTIEPQPPLNMRQCDWSTDPTDPTKASVSLTVVTTAGMQSGGAAGGTYTAEEQFDGTRALYTNAVDVPGLGDGAYTTEGFSLDLNVLSGETVLTLSAVFGDEAPQVTVDQLAALANAAIARLP